MKILQLNKYFYQKGGAETVFFNTISTLENRGHQVIPFALKNKKNKFIFLIRQILTIKCFYNHGLHISPVCYLQWTC